MRYFLYQVGEAIKVTLATALLVSTIALSVLFLLDVIA